jgi:hypothetical protein
MKNIWWVSMALVAFLGVGPLSAQEQNGPRIEFKEMQYDFGKIPQGTQAIHVFEVRNGGKGPLTIQRVQAT